ncbi:hypothetical protein OAO01_06315, partial [Oligoflexia bacterium]|nr:hypothetical protein [Oligoflexia bacterium]
KALRNSVNLKSWRSVFTYMIGRWGSSPELLSEAEQKGIDLNEGDIRWAEFEIFKTLHKLTQAKACKLLVSSLKFDSKRDDTSCESFSRHLEFLSGFDSCVTIPPQFLDKLLTESNPNGDFKETIATQPLPRSTADKLDELEFFKRSRSMEGMPPEEFGFQPAFLKGLSEVNLSYHQLADYLYGLLRSGALKTGAKNSYSEGGLCLKKL